MKCLPGFVSANIHKSLDGTHVVNYGQWRSKEDFEAMLNNPEAAPHMKAAGAIAKFEPTCTPLLPCTRPDHADLTLEIALDGS